jgi:hypothetical protein
MSGIMKNVVALFTALFLTVTLFAQKGEFKIAAIGFYNLENLFDTIDSPTTNDADFLPGGRLHWNAEKYWSKQANMAKVISQLATEKNVRRAGLAGRFRN